MIEVLKIEQAARPEKRIAAIIEEYGAWRVLRAAAQALVRRRPRRPIEARDLPDHLRRDIGMPPDFSVPRAWEMWR